MRMRKATFRFYAELNDFLPQARRGRAFQAQFSGHETVKHVLESLGVPHPELALILINGTSVDFSARIEAGDRVSLYPRFSELDLNEQSPLQEALPDQVAFILDIHLGKLARNLRLLGINALYGRDLSDPELARLAREKKRVLLTRDRGLLKRNAVRWGYILRSEDPREQTIQVIRRYELIDQVQLFYRCPRCNGILGQADKNEVREKLKPLTRKYYDDFQRCRKCGQVYWQGSHFQQLAEYLRRILEEAAEGVENELDPNLDCLSNL